MKRSSLFNSFGNQSSFNNGVANLLKEFQNFKQNFQGNPEQQVKQMLQSGQMTQEQFNKLSQLATYYQKFLGGF